MLGQSRMGSFVKTLSPRSCTDQCTEASAKLLNRTHGSQAEDRRAISVTAHREREKDKKILPWNSLSLSPLVSLSPVSVSLSVH